MEAIIMLNVGLDEYAKVIGKWMGTFTIEEDNETKMASRVTSKKHIWPSG
jgi:hypothetical protein